MEMKANLTRLRQKERKKISQRRSQNGEGGQLKDMDCKSYYISAECLFLHEPANLVRRKFYISQEIFNFTQNIF